VENGISIIICCYNSERSIAGVLERVKIQKDTERFSWEVIVVDNASTDRTAETARAAWTRKEIPFRVVSEGVPGLSNARRKGLAEAVHEFVVFVDDDNLLEEGYIARAHRVMTGHPDVGLAGGFGIPRSSVELPHWFRANEAAFAVGPQGGQAGYVPDSRTYLHGAGLVMRKSVWDMLISRDFTFMLSGRKGKSLTSGEDSELSYAFRLAGYKLWYDPGMKFEHAIPENRLRWSHLARLAGEFGKSAVVLDLYRVRFRQLKGWDRFKVDNWFAGMVVGVYNLARVTPRYVALKMNYREGDHREFGFRYISGYFMQRLSLALKYRSIRKGIDDLRVRISP
jgi:glycosyltransferase involved in cell wall biosynthesis